MIVLDSSAVICLVELFEPPRALILQVVARRPTARMLVSTLTIAECLTQPIRQNDVEVLQRFNLFFDSSDVEVREVSKGIARSAANLRVRFRLKLPDAVQLATAIESGAEDFITTDRSDFAACRGHVATTIHILPRRPDSQTRT